MKKKHKNGDRSRSDAIGSLEFLSEDAEVTLDSDHVITRFRSAIIEGIPWHIAILEAIGQWTTAEEIYRGRLYRYLIDGEAFDWLLLAQRLCEELDGDIPVDERERLFFRGEFPKDVSEEEFKRLIGASKYGAHLNFWYGVTVEEALQMSLEETVVKEQHNRNFVPENDPVDEVFQSIYGEPWWILFSAFLEERGYKESSVMDCGDMREFTYWLFKLRVKRCEPARIASDTRKALAWLQDQTPAWGGSQG